MQILFSHICPTVDFQDLPLSLVTMCCDLKKCNYSFFCLILLFAYIFLLNWNAQEKRWVPFLLKFFYCDNSSLYIYFIFYWTHKVTNLLKFNRYFHIKPFEFSVSEKETIELNRMPTRGRHVKWKLQSVVFWDW